MTMNLGICELFFYILKDLQPTNNLVSITL